MYQKKIKLFFDIFKDDEKNEFCKSDELNDFLKTQVMCNLESNASDRKIIDDKKKDICKRTVIPHNQ